MTTTDYGASGAVDAVLAVTPTDLDGRVLHAAGPAGETWGEARTVAQRQAVEVLRWLAEHRRREAGYPCWYPGDLEDLADEIEGPDDPPPADTTEDLDPDELEAGRG